jgi:hypothetical protein
VPCPRLVYREEAFMCVIMYIISISSILEMYPFLMDAGSLAIDCLLATNH